MIRMPWALHAGRVQPQGGLPEQSFLPVRSALGNENKPS